jgi:endonuclease/exonuclease/phosphatase family metal-dependent hydrolase
VVPDDGALVVVAYNVENLFDARENGNEYDEFLPAAGWSERDVDRRLQGLGAALHDFHPPPDILVVSEIENKALLDRLFREHAVDLPLDYRAFVGGAESATGVAVASRYPIVAVRALLARAGEVPALRPIMEVRLRLPETDMVVFANHWKSKRGGAAATEPLRQATARLLSSRLRDLAREEPDLPIIVAGDLNEQPRENEHCQAAYPTALMDVGTMREWDQRIREIDTGSSHVDGVPVWFSQAYRDARRYVPITRELESLTPSSMYHEVPVLGCLWSSGDALGSYWYFGHWERIDHILGNHAALAGSVISFREFRTVSPAHAVDGDGVPTSWEDGGVSDHVPIMAIFDRLDP